MQKILEISIKRSFYIWKGKNINQELTVKIFYTLSLSLLLCVVLKIRKNPKSFGWLLLK